MYLLGMLAVGFWASRKVHNTADYVLAGRRLPWWLVGGSVFATWFGAETCMGSSAIAYRQGLLGVMMDPFGAGLCLILAGLLLGRYFYAAGYLTVVDFFKARFGERASKLAILFYFPPYLGWIASQLLAFGIILESLTGLPRMPSTIVSAFVVVLYTYTGGMLADVVTDFFQVIFILVGFLAVFPPLLSHVGGWTNAYASTPAHFFHFYPHDASALDWLKYLEAWMIVGIGSLPSQDLIQRMLSAKDAATCRWSPVGAGVAYWGIGLLPVFLGMFGRLVVPEDKGDSILLELVKLYLHPAMAALFVGALLSAIMSTADSALLAPASILGHNVVPLLKPDATEELKLKVCKWSIPVMALLSLGLAYYFKEIYKLCQETFSFMLVSLAAPLLFGIFWKKASAAGCLASFAAGTLSWPLLTWLLPEGQPTKLYAFLCATAALVLGSLVSPQPPPNHDRESRL